MAGRNTRGAGNKRGNSKPKGPSFDELLDLAAEMNEVMGLDPQIDVSEEANQEDLAVEIVNNCYDDEDNCEIYTTDDFSDEALATFKKLGVTPVDPDEEPEEEPEPEPAPKKGAKGAAKKGAAKKDPEPEPEDGPSIEDDIAAVEESDDLEEIKEIAKANGIRIPPPFLKNLKKLKPYVIEKLTAMLPEEEPEEDPEPEPAPKKGARGRGAARGSKKDEGEDYTPPASAKKDTRRGRKGAAGSGKSSAGKKSSEPKQRYTRASAWAEAVMETEEPISLDDLADRSDEIYCEKTGRGEDASNIREAKWIQTHGINILTSLDLAEVADGMFTYKG